MSDKVRKPCKICGKMFTPCADCAVDSSMFRWRRVACSLECAGKYFARIELSRQTPADVHSTPNKDLGGKRNNADISR